MYATSSNKLVAKAASAIGSTSAAGSLVVVWFGGFALSFEKMPFHIAFYWSLSCCGIPW